MMVVVDTSVWIDLFAGRSAPHVAALESLIQQEEDICICGIILTEVLQGIRDEPEFARVRAHFESLIFLPMSYDVFVEAAQMYRAARRAGVTIRKPVDCMIASVAVSHDTPLLHNDRDFELLEQRCGLKLLIPAE